jgi:inward rectifier potassium channel
MTAKPLTDPGLGTHTSKLTERVVNNDGNFNVIRRGAPSDLRDIYLNLLNMTWARFAVFTLGFYLVLNLVFTGLYFLTGFENIINMPKEGLGIQFLNAFFFSVQTITTVGYGVLSPGNVPTSIVAAIESTFGWLVFAMLSGMLYGRFSKPSAKIAYSEHMIIAPLKGINTLQARVANKRSNNIIDIEAKMLLMLTQKNKSGEYIRQFYNLKLEISSTQFFPLSWTLVHPIDDNSPLSGKTAKDLEKMHAEVIVSLRGHDETYNQHVHSRRSYLYDQMIWNARFRKAFFVNEDGSTVLDLDLISDYEEVETETELSKKLASANS